MVQSTSWQPYIHIMFEGVFNVIYISVFHRWTLSGDLLYDPRFEASCPEFSGSGRLSGDGGRVANVSFRITK